jgi:two-component system OmpR family response regulator
VAATVEARVPSRAVSSSKPAVRCLVVDDDEEIRRPLAAFLATFGFAVETAPDGRTMRRLLGAGGHDVVVLDLMLPDENGLDLCRWLRAERPGLPVIVLTALGDPASRVVGLELGADDYVAKPFEPRELVARIHAVLRRAQGGGRDASAAAVVRFGGWRFDRVRRQLHARDGVVVALSAAEFRLLSAFVEHAGRVLTREQLLDLTRAPGLDVSDRSVDLAVSRLRGKLGADAALVRTLRGEGYLFDAVLEP